MIFDTSKPTLQGLPYNPQSVMQKCSRRRSEKKVERIEDFVIPQPRFWEPMMVDYLHINLVYCGGMR